MRIGNILLIYLAFEYFANSQIIPSSNRIDWIVGNTVGVPGGIINRTQIWCDVRVSIPGTNILAVADGITDDSVAISTAIKLCSSNQVVYLPSGTYQLSNQVNIERSFITIRGDGSSTILNYAGSSSVLSAVGLGLISDDNPSVPVQITSGYNKGSSNISVTSIGALTTVGFVSLVQSNDWFVRHNTGSEIMLHWIAKVMSISGTNITFWPPLIWNYDTNLYPQMVYFRNSKSFVGIEDLKIQHLTDSADKSIYGNQLYGCWLKNVESFNVPSKHIFFAKSVMCEVRDCYVHEAHAYGPNQGSGIELYGGIASGYTPSGGDSGFLIENNILNRCNPGIFLNISCSGNVIGYNFMNDDRGSGGLVNSSMNVNHYPHDMMNLFEGNVGCGFQSDGYFGSSSHNTVFRNWLTASTTNVTMTGNFKSVDLCRWSYYFYVIGNILGTSGFTGPYEQWTNGYDMSVPCIYRLGYPNMGNSSYTGTNPPSTDILALDMNVLSNLFRHANYDFKNNSVVYDPSIPYTTISNSYYLSGKPTWFSNAAWPPIGPDIPLMTNMIPAQYRFYGLDYGGSMIQILGKATFKGKATIR